MSLPRQQIDTLVASYEALHRETKSMESKMEKVLDNQSEILSLSETILTEAGNCAEILNNDMLTQQLDLVTQKLSALTPQCKRFGMLVQKNKEDIVFIEDFATKYPNFADRYNEISKQLVNFKTSDPALKAYVGKLIPAIDPVCKTFIESNAKLLTFQQSTVLQDRIDECITLTKAVFSAHKEKVANRQAQPSATASSSTTTTQGMFAPPQAADQADAQKDTKANRKPKGKSNGCTIL